MSLDYRITNLCLLLGIDENSNKKTIDRRYNQILTKYRFGKIDFDTFVSIDVQYQEYLEYIDEINSIKEDEKNYRKKMFLYETHKMNEEIRKQKELEEHMGPIRVFFESVREEEFNIKFDDFIEYIKQNILDLLEENDRHYYIEFLDLFLDLWKKIYMRLTNLEKDMLLRDKIFIDSILSIGEDELTDEYYKRNRCFNPYGKYSRLLKLSQYFSSFIPDVSNNYFLDVHFSLMAGYFNFGYGIDKFRNIPIYSFVIDTRLREFKEEFYSIFDEEVRIGVRQNKYVDNTEMLKFISNRLDEFNSCKNIPDNLSIKKREAK